MSPGRALRRLRDAFGAAHRAHASSCYAGRCRCRRPDSYGQGVEYLGQAMNRIGGALRWLSWAGPRCRDKIGASENLVTKVDALVGGGMAYTFLKAQGMRSAPRCSRRTSWRWPGPSWTRRGPRAWRSFSPWTHVIAQKVAADAETLIVESTVHPDWLDGTGHRAHTARQAFATAIRAPRRWCGTGAHGRVRVGAVPRGHLRRGPRHRREAARPPSSAVGTRWPRSHQVGPGRPDDPYLHGRRGLLNFLEGIARPLLCGADRQELTGQSVDGLNRQLVRASHGSFPSRQHQLTNRRVDGSTKGEGSGNADAGDGR